MATCGNVPDGKAPTARMPNSSYSRRIWRTVPVTSFGSVMLPDGTKRSGCRFSAAREFSSPTPIIPISTPCRSISCRVTETGSSVGRSCGTSLKMYSTGNRISLEAWSLVCLRMKS